MRLLPLSWHMPWVRWVLLSILALVIVGGVIYGTGWYPIITVNGSVVWARSERISFRLAWNFYHNMENQTNKQFRAPQNSDLKKAVYDGLVDDILIYNELRTILSPSELEEKTVLRVREMISTPQALEQVLSFTKMSQKDTETYFLNPFARQQILAELLTVKRNQDFRTWLLSARTNARIVFWFMRGKWNKEKGYEYNS